MLEDRRIIFQVLACKVVIKHEDPAISETFRYVVEHAEQALRIRKVLTYDVRGSGPWKILEEGDHLDTFESMGEVLDVIYSRVYQRVFERLMLCEWIALHAALVTINGRRTMLLGHKGAGKTTLTLRLMYAGHRVEGDEMVLVKGGRAIALPRRFHLKPKTEQLVPEVRNLVPNMSSAGSGHEIVRAFDPLEAGFAWGITISSVDRVIWIEPNHGGRTKLTRKGSFATLQNILERSFSGSQTHRILVREVTKLAKSGGYELILGHPLDAVHALAA
ncbi:MAG: hypothetical protein ACR2PG_10640 [Hyphomicrobiaceae bacterium]